MRPASLHPPLLLLALAWRGMLEAYALLRARLGDAAAARLNTRR